MAQLPTTVEQKSSLKGELDYSLTNNGIFGFDALNGGYGFFAPRGSGLSYMFGSGLWFGAKKWVPSTSSPNKELRKLSFMTFNIASATSWATPGEAKRRPQDPQPTPALFYSPDYTTNGTNFQDRTQPNWPLWLRPSERTSPLFTGSFVPLATARLGNSDPFDAPAFMSGVAEQFVARFHDMDLSRYELAALQAEELGYPLGLQVEQHVYSWSFDEAFNKSTTVLLHYKIINVSNDTLLDCYAAQVTDPDIGEAGNDHQGFAVPEQPNYRVGLTWSGSESQQLGTLAHILLEGPITDSDGFIDNSLRKTYKTEGRTGTFRNWSSGLTLRTPEERYDMIAQGTRDTFSGPDDWRTVMGTTPFHMAPGDTAYITFAYAVIDSPNPIGDLPFELTDLMGTLLNEYYETGFTNTQISTVMDAVQPSMQVAPNPATNQITLHIPLSTPSDVEIHVSDYLGRVLYSTTLQNQIPGNITHSLPVHRFPNGHYLLRLHIANQDYTTALHVIR